jgi:cytochrome P450
MLPSTSPERVTRTQPPLRDPPLARGLPVLGVLPELIYDGPQTLSRIAHRHHGEIVNLRLGPARPYLVSHPEHLQYILHSNEWRNFGKGNTMWRALGRLIRLGMAANDGEIWRRHRQLLQPLFTPRNLNAIFSLMGSVVDHGLAPFERAAATRRPIDIVHELVVITQDVILETLFGCSVVRGEADNLAKAVGTAMRALNLRMLLYFLPERLPLPGEFELRRALRDLDEAMAALLEKRRREGYANGKDMLSLLLRASEEAASEGLNDREIQDELVSMFVGGNDTTAMTVAWAFYLLQQNPAAEERMRAEIDSVLGDRLPTSEDLERLPYGRMVLQETLRLYPTAWLFPRQSFVDDVIDGYRIPKGATLILCIYATHHDPHLWEYPEVFEPERFTPERSANRHRYAYYPFGGGPRLCIGHLFSMMEGQLILTRVLQRYRVRVAPGWQVKPRAYTTLQPRGGMQVLIERR